MSDSPVLNIAIVGAGLAGLTSARILREKHNVTIYERSAEIRDIGAGINIGPNGVKIFDSIGLDRTRARSIPCAGTRFWNKQGKVISEAPVDFKKQYGADWLLQHRADLREELLRLATEDSANLNLSGNPAKVALGMQVVDVDVDEGKLVFANGEVVHADLIVAADGIKSTIRPFVVGDAALTTARPSGASAFRFTMPSERAREVTGDTLEFLKKGQPPFFALLPAFDGSKRLPVFYPCRDFEVLNFVCIIQDSSLKNPTTESWTAEGDRDELVEIFKDYPEWFVAFLSNAEDVKLWQLRDQDPLPTYIKGRTVLVGDAAHAMTPHQGQGATQAIEDADGFRLFLRPHISRDLVPQILEGFDSVRRPRASEIQMITRTIPETRTPKEMYDYTNTCWNYPGIEEGLRRIKAGEKLIQY